MRRRTSLSILLTTVLVVAPALSAQQKAQFLVPILDRDGNPPASFKAEDLAVHEGGKSARVLSVEPRNRPLNVTLAIDNGRMLGDILVHIRTHAKSFFDGLPDGAEMSLVTTAPTPRYVVRNNKDREALKKAVDRIAADGGPGRFIESLQDVIGTWWKMPRETNFVLVTFGSTYSGEFINKARLDEASDRLTALRGTVHAVMFRPAGATEGDAQHDSAKRAASQSLGQFHEIGSYLQLAVIPDLAKEVAKAAGTGRVFLVTIERPEGASGALGPLSLSTPGGLTPGRITRLP